MVMSILLLVLVLPSTLWTLAFSQDPEYMPSQPDDPYIPVQTYHAFGGFVGILTSLFAIIPGVLGLIFRTKSLRLPCNLAGGLLIGGCIASMIFLQDRWFLLLPMTFLAVLYFISSFLGRPMRPQA